MSANGEAISGQEVLITWPDFDQDGIGAELRALGLGLRLEPKLGVRTPAELADLVAGACAAIVSTDPFDAEVLDSTQSLRVIARVGVGIDSIDLAAATANGVAVTVTPGINEVVVAEHTIALMLSLARRLGEHDHGIRAGEWRRTGSATPWSLRGSTVGLVGLGRIGSLVAERLSPFGANLLATDPARRPSGPGIEQVGLDELLARADFVSLHCPLLPATRNLVGAREIGLMSRDAVLINTSRGEIVDENALVEALTVGRLRAAGLDVFAVEPPVDPRLLALPNVLMSPHNAALSERSVAEMTRLATASVIDVLAGRVPAHLVNPEALAGAASGVGGGDA